MSEFDQQIKNKMGEAQYAYRPSAWRSFARHAGIRRIWPWIWSSAVVAVAVSVALFFLLKPAHRPADTSVQPSEPEVPSVAMTDALANDTDAVQMIPDKMLEADVATSCYFGLEKDEIAPDISTHEPPKVEVLKDTKPELIQPYGIPITISADTITQMWPTDEELKNGHSRLY